MSDVPALLEALTDGPAGARLPPERELARTLGVSRTLLRKRLSELEAAGRLVRHVGRGTFLRRDEPAASPDVKSLCRTTSPRDAMQARMLLEPELAGMAAVHATADQIDAMRALNAQMRAAGNWADYAQADGFLHCLVAACSGNTLLAAVHDIIDEVRRAVVWRWLDNQPDGPYPGYSSFAEHDALVDAIERRDRLGAAEAMRAHLRTTRARLLGVQD